MKKQEKGSLSLPHTTTTKVNISSQMGKIKAYFSSHIGTMLDCAKATGIERASICRRIAELKRENRITLLGIGRDETTHHKAAYYTIKGKGGEE